MRGIKAAQPSYGENTAARVMVEQMTKMLEATFERKANV
jgi:hypothetical protein